MYWLKSTRDNMQVLINCLKIMLTFIRTNAKIKTIKQCVLQQNTKEIRKDEQKEKLKTREAE